MYRLAGFGQYQPCPSLFGHSFTGTVLPTETTTGAQPSHDALYSVFRRWLALRLATVGENTRAPRLRVVD